MHKIIFISTIHEENGKCNADELCRIIEKINPEAIFLEALEETYSTYQKYLFTTFQIYHEKLEIKAIQKYKNQFEYIPVLDKGLPDAFEKKYNSLSGNIELQTLIQNFYSFASEHGFEFLNSKKSSILQEEMRILENQFLANGDFMMAFDKDLDLYENSMIRNIYSYCRNNQFNTAIFMCGVAHRKSIIEKVYKHNSLVETPLKWEIFET